MQESSVRPARKATVTAADMLRNTVPAPAMFDYQQAFKRNLGWVTTVEQLQLRKSRVAIAGLGGVGGAYLTALARLGIGAFSLAEFDQFELSNFNRQAGATVSAIGRPKLEVMVRAARDINPDLSLRTFPEGVTPENLDLFLEGAAVYVDGLDFFAFEVRRQVFRRCAERGIPVVTVAPLGMGAALLVFLPGGISVDDYFQFEDDLPEDELALRFLVGLGPAMLHTTYLADPRRVRLEARRGPSTVMACQLCTGIAATEVLKLILKRGPITAAPRGVHYDAYRQRLVKTWRPWGNRNPWQRLVLAIARKRLLKKR